MRRDQFLKSVLAITVAGGYPLLGQAAGKVGALPISGSDFVNVDRVDSMNVMPRGWVHSLNTYLESSARLEKSPISNG